MKEKKILVQDDINYDRAISGLGLMTDDTVDFLMNPKDYKMVLLTGGADVSPELYNDTSPERFCSCDPMRDALELQIANAAYENGIIMAGICRGAQFLNVFSGGRMMHHIDNHGGVHHLMTVSVLDIDIMINSLHHQMIIPGDEGHIVGWSTKNRSKEYYGKEDKLETWEDEESEVIVIPKFKSFGVQYHPEMMPKDSQGYNFFYNMVKNALEMDFDDFSDAYIYGNDNVRYLDQQYMKKGKAGYGFFH